MTDPKPLTEWTPATLRGLLDKLHTDRHRYGYANRIVEIRSCDLEIAEATRALAIINRRATEAEDQRVGRLEDVMRRLHETSERSKDDGLRIVRQDVFDELLALAPTEDQRDAEERALTEERVREVVRGMAADLIRHPDTFGGPESKVDAIATRAAKELSGAVVGTEQRDRIVTIADEAFGLGPVEPLDATLTRIERGISEQHKRLVNLEMQREADLRDAFLDGMSWAYGRSRISIDQSRDQAAAEYARSKAGG